MIGRLFTRILGNIASNEKIVDKLAETKTIRRAAQLTAYGIHKLQENVSKNYSEYLKAGGLQNLKKLTYQDIDIVRKTARQFMPEDANRKTAKAMRDAIEKLKEAQRKP